MTDYYDRMLAPSGITVSQFSLLRNLRRLEVATASDLADRVELERSTLVRTLKPLLEAGLIEDKAAPGTRNRRLRVTAAGEQVLAEALARWREAQKGIAKRLGSAGVEQLHALAEQLREL